MNGHIYEQINIIVFMLFFQEVLVMLNPLSFIYVYYCLATNSVDFSVKLLIVEPLFTIEVNTHACIRSDMNDDN